MLPIVVEHTPIDSGVDTGADAFAHLFSMRVSRILKMSNVLSAVHIMLADISIILSPPGRRE